MITVNAFTFGRSNYFTMNFSKFGFAFLLVLAAYFSYGGHETGGVIITYKSVATSPATQFDYEVTAYAIYDSQGPSSPSTYNIMVSSGCFPNQNITLNRLSTGGSVPILGIDYCTTANPNPSTQSLVTYRGTVTLAGTCSDFRFSISIGFGRFSSMTNFSSNFNSNYFYADLNNTLGPNNSPEPNINQLIQAACLNKPLNLYNHTEADGDSLYFSASVPTYISGGTVSNFSYASGYSAANQINSTAGFSVNPATGVVQTQATLVGSFAITVRYQEYKKDTSGTAVQIGESRYTMMLYGSGSCYTPAFNLTLNQPSISDTVPCGDSVLTLAATRILAKSTLTNTGSEFRVNSQLSGMIPVVSASIFSDSLIEIRLGQPIAANDDLKVYAVNGTDSSVIFSQCGQELSVGGDTLQYYSTTAAAPVAAFISSANLLSANFMAGGGFPSVVWDFGDGSPTDSTNNPNHIYAQAGTYSVQLIVFNACGLSDTTVQSVTVCDTLSAAFSHTTSGDTLFVAADTTSGGSQFLWDFGDGNSGTGASTHHFYQVSGNQQVTLTVINACGDSAVFADSVALCQPPFADWTYTIQSSGGGGLVIQFDAGASQNATSYSWDFGDNSSVVNGVSPVHTYVTPSLNYLVTLTVENSCQDSDSHAYRLNEIGENEFSMENAVQIFPIPADDKLYFNFEKVRETRATLKLRDASGKIIREETLDFSIEKSKYLECSGLAAGMYLLSIQTKNGDVHHKIQIQH